MTSYWRLTRLIAARTPLDACRFLPVTELDFTWLDNFAINGRMRVALSLLLLLALAAPVTGLSLQKRLEDLTEEEAAKVWMEEIAHYIIMPYERDTWKRLTTSEERVRFIDAFWKRRDPTPETPENEYQIEHYRRLAYANKFFGAGRPGYKTDRGRLYILLGPPNEIDSDPMGRHMHQYPTEVWLYRDPPHPSLPQNMEIAFVDTRSIGEYEITYNLLADSDSSRRTEAFLGTGLLEPETVMEIRAMNLGRMGTLGLGLAGRQPEMEGMANLALVSQVPARQLRPLSEAVTATATFNRKPLDAARAIEFFRAGEGHVCTPVTVRLAYSDFTLLEKPDRYETRVDIFGRIVGMDGTVIDEFNREETITVASDRIRTLEQEFMLYQLIFYAPPGEYRLLLAVRDHASNTIRSSEETIRVPDLGPPSTGLAHLKLSSVVLSEAIVKLDPPPPPGEKQPFRFGDFEVYPNFRRIFRTSGALNIYLEAYNVALDAEGKNSIQLSYRIQMDGKPYREVPATYLYPTDQRQRSILSAIPLKDFEPGDYTLVVSVSDAVAGETATAETDFSVR